jgi:hypothetical protein
LFTKSGLNICPCLVEHKRGKQDHPQASLSPQKDFGERRFSASGPFLWNRMPESIREAKTIDAFKHLLKAWLFEIAFGERSEQVTLELRSIQIYVLYFIVFTSFSVW